MVVHNAKQEPGSSKVKPRETGFPGKNTWGGPIVDEVLTRLRNRRECSKTSKGYVETRNNDQRRDLQRVSMEKKARKRKKDEERSWEHKKEVRGMT